VAAEQIVEYSHFGVLLSRDGNRGPEAVPQGLYRCPDDPDGAEQWIAIAVQDGDQWATLLDALDAPEQLRRYQTAAQRRAAADEIDAWLGAACANRDCPTLVERMWDAGVPVARLSMPHDQDRLPQLAARGWWQEIDHPVIGRSLHGGLPVRFSLGPTVVHRLPPPMLGQHNVEILTGLLGLTEQELAELEDKTVIGTQPGGNTRLN
jgi:crotonobetainyl-CoA:carnitine CoA-transferase CaiB-like acyl-CoA transferase